MFYLLKKKRQINVIGLLGITKQECVENCELFEGCQEDKCREICYNCDDEGKCRMVEKSM